MESYKLINCQKSEYLEEIIQIAILAARSAGNIIVEIMDESLDIVHKGRVDLVTKADKESERFITDMIKKKFPSHGIIAEEGTLFSIDNENLWIIDPLDGTTNYSHGYPNFSISIAYAFCGIVQAGVVYNPTRGELFFAKNGFGAYLGNEKIKVSETKEIVNSLIATGFPYDRKKKLPRTAKTIEALAARAQSLRADGSAALDLCYVAAGRFDGFWEIELAPWDTAAGSLILKEAGGVITDGFGLPYNLNSKEIIASNNFIQQDLVEIVDLVRKEIDINDYQ